MNEKLIEAAKAVIDRWYSPLWKDLPHTGEFINRLREAVADSSCEFDQWLQNPYTKVLLKSIAEDYIPKPPIVDKKDKS